MDKSAVKVIIDKKKLFKQSLEGDFKANINTLTYHIQELTYARHAMIGKAWPEYDFTVHRTPMFWKCPDSPIGYCIYNSLEDPAFDDCLFCHDPHERK